MAKWIKPVYDRTQADVDYAKLKLAQWSVRHFSADSPFVMDLKACLNAYDLNRIEGNTEILAERISNSGYPVKPEIRIWTETDFPLEPDVQRVIQNVALLIATWYQQQGAPILPDNLLTYEDVNSVEKNLALIKELLDYKDQSVQKSGMFQSGSRRWLPIRPGSDDPRKQIRKAGALISGVDIYLPIKEDA